MNNRNKRGILIVISAPSGAGKTTLCQRLLAEFPEISLSISCTTRAPRGQEQNGREYFFLKREEFEQKIQAGDFSEWAEVHGNLYGTSKSFLEECLDRGQSVLLDIDVQGAHSLRESFGPACFSIFIAPPDVHTLETRLRARGTDSEASIQRRMQAARDELEQAPEFDLTIVNQELDAAYAQLARVVRQALQGGHP